MIVNTAAPPSMGRRRPWLLLLLSLGAFLCPGCHCDDKTITLAELNNKFRCVKENMPNLAGGLGKVMDIKDGGNKIGFNPGQQTGVDVYFAMLVSQETLHYKIFVDNKHTPPTPKPGVAKTCIQHILDHGSMNMNNQFCNSTTEPVSEGNEKGYSVKCNWGKYVQTIEQGGERIGSYYFTVGNLWTDSSYDKFECPWRAQFDDSVFRLLVKTKDVENSKDLLDKTDSIETCLDASVASFFGCLFGSSLFLILFILAILLLLTLIGLILLIILWKPKKKKVSKGRPATKHGDTQQINWMRTKGVSEIHKPEGAHGWRTTLMTTKPTGRTTGGGWTTAGGKTGKTTGGGWFSRTFTGFTRPQTTGKTKQPTATTGGGGRTKPGATTGGGRTKQPTAATQGGRTKPGATTGGGRTKQPTATTGGGGGRTKPGVTVPDTGSADPNKRGGGTTYEHLEQSNPRR